jgi:hypothetical protein
MGNFHAAFGTAGFFNCSFIPKRKSVRSWTPFGGSGRLTVTA